MPSILKKLKRFLSGKASPEGSALYDAWYKSFDDTGATEELDATQLERELREIKQRPPGQPLSAPAPLPYWRAAAAVLAIGLSGLYLYKVMHAPIPLEDYTAYNTQAGQRRQVTLADGTSVWLNAGTELRAPEAFNDNTREVYLTGEAYFEVTRNPDKPFIIHAGDLNTTVLGTVFNVQHYHDQQPEVAVVSGKVSVTYKGHAVVLTRGKKAIVTDGILSSALFEDFDRYSSWKDGKLVLEDQPVTEVLRTVNRFYGLDIRIKDEALGSCSISTTLEPMAEQDLVDLLCLLLNATAQKEGAIYWISGSGCH